MHSPEKCKKKIIKIINKLKKSGVKISLVKSLRKTKNHHKLVPSREKLACI